MQGCLAGSTLRSRNACGRALRHMQLSGKAAHIVTSCMQPRLHSACRTLNKCQGDKILLLTCCFDLKPSARASTSRSAGSLQFLLERLTWCCCAMTGCSRCTCKLGWSTVRSSRQIRGLQLATASGPDISLLKTHLQEEWDHEANAWLGPKVIRPYINQKVQWVCTKCPNGHAHVWQSAVHNRSDGSGCPYCAGKAVCQHNALASLAPSIASEWDFDTNQLTPYDYTCHSGAIVGWRCSSCQHSWKAHIHRRTLQFAGCPECAVQKRRKRRKQPSLTAAGTRAMQHWDHERNAAEGLNPANITLGSSKKVHWLCSECPMGVPHRWYVSPNARFKSSGIVLGCPCCSQPKKQACKCNSLQTLYPEIAAEWDFTKNDDTPDDFTAYSYQIVWWINDKRGSWQQSIRLRTEPAYRRVKKAALKG